MGKGLAWSVSVQCPAGVGWHAEAERTEGHLLPPIIADLLERNEHRRANRRQTWRQHTAAERARAAAYQTHDPQPRHAEQTRGRTVDGYGWNCNRSVLPADDHADDVLDV